MLIICLTGYLVHQYKAKLPDIDGIDNIRGFVKFLCTKHAFFEAVFGHVEAAKESRADSDYLRESGVEFAASATSTPKLFLVWKL